MYDEYMVQGYIEKKAKLFDASNISALLNKAKRNPGLTAAILAGLGGVGAGAGALMAKETPFRGALYGMSKAYGLPLGAIAGGSLGDAYTQAMGMDQSIISDSLTAGGAAAGTLFSNELIDKLWGV